MRIRKTNENIIKVVGLNPDKKLLRISNLDYALDDRIVSSSQISS